MTAIIVIRSPHPIDGHQAATAVNLVASISSSPRLSDDSGSQIAWVMDDVPASDFAELVTQLRQNFGATASVTAVTIGGNTPPAPPAAAPAAERQDDFGGLQFQHSVGSIAQ